MPSVTRRDPYRRMRRVGAAALVAVVPLATAPLDPPARAQAPEAVQAETGRGPSRRAGAGAFEALAAERDRLGERALRGDPAAQHRLALMLFYGEGGPRDIAAARQWLEAAAHAGHPLAQANLVLLGVVTGQRTGTASAGDGAALLAALATVGEDALRDDLLGLDGLADDGGEKTFLTYCSGCHGFGGVAAYPPAPSFAFGDRLFKDDEALLETVREGRGAMPSWKDKLPDHMLRAAIRYLRSLALWTSVTGRPRTGTLPRRYFRFRPLGTAEEPWWEVE